MWAAHVFQPVLCLQESLVFLALTQDTNICKCNIWQLQQL